MPLALLAPPGVRQLSSRAEARRVAERLDRFAVAELDFTGFEHIGHGFADELFRVIGRRHPTLRLQPVGAAASVTAMIEAVQAAA